MLKGYFQTALNSREPLENSNATDAPAADGAGNAFTGGKASMDRETIHAVQAGLMQDDEAGGTVIANAAQVLAGRMNAELREKEKKKSSEFYLQTVRQRMLEDLNDRLAEIDDQLRALDNINKMMEDGSFDPQGNAEHLALLQRVDPSMTLERWDAMDELARAEWSREQGFRLNEERAQTQSKINVLSDPNAEIAADRNRFVDSDFEAAAVRIEERTGQEFDRHNLTEESRVELFTEIYLEREENNRFQQTLGSDNTVEIVTTAYQDITSFKFS